jgi:hypothetical protein
VAEAVASSYVERALLTAVLKVTAICFLALKYARSASRYVS